jgi:hypothetical protein
MAARSGVHFGIAESYARAKETAGFSPQKYIIYRHLRTGIGYKTI